MSDALDVYDELEPLVDAIAVAEQVLAPKTPVGVPSERSAHPRARQEAVTAWVNANRNRFPTRRAARRGYAREVESVEAK